MAAHFPLSRHERTGVKISSESKGSKTYMQKSGWLMFLLMSCFYLQCTPGHKAPDSYFRGEIVYSYTYESDVLNVDSLTAIKPHTGVFRYDSTGYMSRFIDKDTFSYYYSGRYNKCIAETNGRKDYTCEDYGVATDSIHHWKVYDTDEKILGYSCRIIEYKTNIFWNRYYISKDLRIAPATYQKHKAYNWSFYGEKSEGGLILKLEHRFKNYTMKGIATSVDTGDESFKAFAIPDSLFVTTCKQKQE